MTSAQVIDVASITDSSLCPSVLCVLICTVCTKTNTNTYPISISVVLKSLPKNEMRVAHANVKAREFVKYREGLGVWALGVWA